MQKARIAFRYGHFGDCFHGSQVQPGLPTVQGEFITAFRKLKWSEERMPVSMASRTDAGVHVRMNGGFIDIDAAKWQPMAEKGFLKAVGHQLPKSISLFDAKRVADDWSPRRALRRTYRYRLECIDGWIEPELELFTKWCNYFVGNFDWRNFCRRETGRTTIRVVEQCKPWISQGRIIGFEIIGEAFVWNQVRRIASALYYLVTEYYDEELVLRARDNPDEEIDLGLADSDWLVLWSVEWEEFEKIESKEPTLEKPDLDSVRWQEICKLEQKEMMIRQFDLIQGEY
mgnify:FL=1